MKVYCGFENNYYPIFESFNNIVFGKGVNSHLNLESIRDSYKAAYGISIHDFEISETLLSVPGNPIRRVNILIGPVETLKVKNFILPTRNGIEYNVAISNNIFKGFHNLNWDEKRK